MKASDRDENGEGRSVESFLDAGVQPENVASTMQKGVTLSEKWRTCSKRGSVANVADAGVNLKSSEKVSNFAVREKFRS